MGWGMLDNNQPVGRKGSEMLRATVTWLLSRVPALTVPQLVLALAAGDGL